MDKLLTMAVIGTILGFVTFLVFFLSSYYGHNFFGVPNLANFLTICGLIAFFIFISLIFLLKAPRYNE